MKSKIIGGIIILVLVIACAFCFVSLRGNEDEVSQEAINEVMNDEDGLIADIYFTDVVDQYNGIEYYYYIYRIDGDLEYVKAKDVVTDGVASEEEDVEYGNIGSRDDFEFIRDEIKLYEEKSEHNDFMYRVIDGDEAIEVESLDDVVNAVFDK